MCVYVFKGGTAVDAVVAGLKYLENDIVFDAGYGSCLNLDGDVEMDAIIIDGNSLNIGAVAGIKNIKNPIEVAKLVLDKSQHNLFVGEGACRFAKENGIEEVDPLSLVSKDSLKAWKDSKEKTINNQYESVVTSYFENNQIKEEEENQKIIYDKDKDNQEIQRNDQKKKYEEDGHDTVGIVVLDSYGSIASGTTTGGITGKAVGRVGDSPLVGSG